MWNSRKTLYALLHEDDCKYTWNESGRTLIDYALTISKLSHFVLGIHVCKGSDIRYDHIFLISKDR